MAVSTAPIKMTPATFDKAVGATEKTEAASGPRYLQEIVRPAPIAPPVKSSIARNHLAFIVLALVLLYSVAGAAVAFGPLPAAQKAPLVWLMFIFPLASLVLLGWLVGRHAPRLYAEANAPIADESTVTLLTPEQQQRKFNLDIAALVRETVEQTGYTPDAETIQVMRSDYLMAEDLVLRRLDLEHSGTLRRHVSIEGAAYDAVVITDQNIRAIEVKFLPTIEVRLDAIDALLDKAEYTAQRLSRTAPGKKFYVLLALVVEAPERERLRLREGLLNRFGVTAVNLELEFFDYGELQSVFAAGNPLV